MSPIYDDLPNKVIIDSSDENKVIIEDQSNKVIVANSGAQGATGPAGATGATGPAGTSFTGYDYEIHVSQVDGNDTTGNGDLLTPVATITKALTLVGSQRKTIIVHPGTYTESPSITVQYTTITGPGLIGGNIVISGTVSTNKGCTIAGIKMTNLTVTAPSGTGNVNILNCEVSGTFTKSSNADYTVLRLCDLTAASITGAGLVAIFGGNPNFITVNNASANVIVKSAVTVAPVLTAGTLSLVDSVVAAAVTNAVTSAASSVITLANCQLLTSALNNVAPVVLNGFYSILNCVYNKSTSTLVALSGTGGSTNSIDYFQYINADKFITQGGTSSQFVKGDGSLDPTGPVGPTGATGATGATGPGVIAGGVAGQLLAKIDSTDYNTEWIDNYANWTSQLKHEVKLGLAIAKGQAVYVSSADGTNMIVSKASNVSEGTSSKTMGLLETSGSTNAKVKVITEGLLSGLNTASAAAGDPVWLGVDGNLIYGLLNKPYAPAHLVFIGIVTRSNINNGEIFVKVQNGFELKEIHDVDLLTTLPVEKDLLVYENSTSLWKNKSFSNLGLAKTDAVNAFTTGGHTISSEAVGVFPLSIIPFTGQTANTFRVRNSANSGDLFSIDSSGQVRSPAYLNPNSFNNSRIRPLDAGTIIDTGIAANIALKIQNVAATPTGDLQQWLSTGGTVLAKVLSTGEINAPIFFTSNSYAGFTEQSSGGALRLTKLTAIGTNPGAGVGRIYFRDGTTAGTLKLVVRAGAAGAETTILDNIPQ